MTSVKSSTHVDLAIGCSPEQLDIVENHLINDAELGILPDERHWMIAKARSIYPLCKIVSADLDLENGKWKLKVIV